MMSHEKKPTLVIIGGGGSALSLAWLLDGKYQILMFEKEAYLGGHAISFPIEYNHSQSNFDLLFSAFSNNYLLFTSLLKILKIKKEKQKISFNWIHQDLQERYPLPFSLSHFLSCTNKRKYLKLGLRLKLFLNYAAKLDSYHVTIEDLANQHEIFNDEQFKEEFLYPFLALPLNLVKKDYKKLSAKFLYELLDFEGFNNTIQFQWYKIQGGASEYIKTLSQNLKNTTIYTSTKITSVKKMDGKYHIYAGETCYQADHLVLATNANCISQFMSEDFNDLISISSKITYRCNTVFIYTDASPLPADPKKWALYNEFFSTKNETIPVLFWIGKTKELPIFATARAPDNFIDESKIFPHTRVTACHPVMNPSAMEAREALSAIQGKDNLWIIGNYMSGVTFHESCLQSALAVAQKLNPDSNNIKLLKKNVSKWHFCDVWKIPFNEMVKALPNAWLAKMSNLF
jgi:predicted NAD/FAD-binding protein